MNWESLREGTSTTTTTTTQLMMMLPLWTVIIQRDAMNFIPCSLFDNIFQLSVSSSPHFVFKLNVAQYLIVQSAPDLLLPCFCLPHILARYTEWLVGDGGATKMKTNCIHFGTRKYSKRATETSLLYKVITRHTRIIYYTCATKWGGYKGNPIIIRGTKHHPSNQLNWKLINSHPALTLLCQQMFYFFVPFISSAIITVNSPAPGWLLGV